MYIIYHICVHMRLTQFPHSHYCPRNVMSFTDAKFDTWMLTQEATWSISE